MATMDKNTPIGVRAMAAQATSFPESTVKNEAAENETPIDFSGATEQAGEAPGTPSGEE